jgi:hypothetical protein
LSSLISHGLNDADLLGGITIGNSLGGLSSLEFGLLGFTLSLCCGLLSLGEFAISVSITSRRGLSILGSTGGLSFSRLLGSGLVRKWWGS